MTMQLEFTPVIQESLNDERYHLPLLLVQRWMEALWLRSPGLPHSQIAQLVGITENTLWDYFQLYQDGGVKRLKVGEHAGAGECIAKALRVVISLLSCPSSSDD
jgi:hypothetical protein